MPSVCGQLARYGLFCTGRTWAVASNTDQVGAAGRRVDSNLAVKPPVNRRARLHLDLGTWQSDTLAHQHMHTNSITISNTTSRCPSCRVASLQWHGADLESTRVLVRAQLDTWRSESQRRTWMRAVARQRTVYESMSCSTARAHQYCPRFP